MISLIKYILKRFLQLIPTYIIVITLVFFVSRMLPGDPFLYQIERITLWEIEKYDNAIIVHGLDQSLWIQFQFYIRNLLTGNWGTSWYIADGMPVWPLIKNSLLNSLEFLVIALTFSYFVGTRLGRYAATHKKQKRSNFWRIFLSMGSSIPIVLLGTVSSYFMGHDPILFRYFTGIKSYDMGDPSYITGLRLLDCLLTLDFNLALDTSLHYLMPVLSFSLPIIMLVSQQTRSSMLDVLKCDYIRTAHAKGCTPKLIQNRHAFRNALMPVISIMGMSLSLFFSNLIIVEYIFGLPGFGFIFFATFKYLDYNVLIAISALSVTFTMIGNFLADILYAIVDPRVIY